MNQAALRSIKDIKQLIDLDHLDEASFACNTQLQAQPDNIKLMQLGAAIERRRSNQPAAVALMQKASERAPHNHALQLAYSVDLSKAGRLEEAEAVLAKVALVMPADGNVVLHKARLQYQRSEYTAATDTLVELVRRQPRFAAAHMNLAQVLLMRGKWRAGWLEYEARYHLPESRDLLPRLPTPLWDGQALKGTIVVIADQGYGDCFQFSRYLPQVATRCEKLVLGRSPPLIGLLDGVAGVNSCHAQLQDLPPHQAHITLSGLPRLFETRSHNIPPAEKLLTVDEQRVAYWQQRVGSAAENSRLRIGLTWSGRLDYSDNYLRAVPAPTFKPLLKLTSYTFFSLQFGLLAAEADALGLINMADELSPFSEAAAMMRALDLVITTDTATAHLAGTLGIPTWLLLSAAPDWRWGPVGTTSLWYPSLRLFRQDHTRSWSTVIATVTSALETIAAAVDSGSALANFMTQHDSVTTHL